MLYCRWTVNPQLHYPVWWYGVDGEHLTLIDLRGCTSWSHSGSYSREHEENCDTYALHNRFPCSRTLCFLRLKSLIQYIHCSDNVYNLRLTTLLLRDKPQTHLSVPWLIHIPLHGMKRKFWLLNKFVNLQCFKFMFSGVITGLDFIIQCPTPSLHTYL